jgi:uncharacterized protein (TIGR03663 family)
VGTASTKSRSRKIRRSSASKEKQKVQVRRIVPDIPKRAWYIASAVILAVAAIMRLYDLTLNPFHHDEGVNGNFLVRLVREGYYRYDPANYHGPTLYYLTLPFTTLFGLKDFSLRLLTVVFGLFTVVLILFLRRYIGTVGSLMAAALFAISSGSVYFSRYYIHEMLFICFSLGIVVAAVWYYETLNPHYLFWASVSAALLFATKETAFITVGVYLIALGCVEFYVFLRRKVGLYVPSRRVLAAEGWIRDGRVIALSFVFAIAVFLFINILFYSSFFTNKQGIYDSISALAIWSKTSETSHVYPWYTYFKWLWTPEPALLLLGGVGILLALILAENRFVIFTAAWAIGTTSAYSIIGYKTPWLALSFILPLTIISGYMVEVVYKRLGVFHLVGTVLAIILAVSALSVSLYKSIDLNFYNYDNNNGEHYPYVYAHTTRSFKELWRRVELAAEKSGKGKEVNITVASPEHWPMPWYTRDYKRTGYIASTFVGGDADIVIGSQQQDAELKRTLGDRYIKVGAYDLRPGVPLVLYVLKELA